MSKESTEKVINVGFNIDGEWLANFARTRVDEGRWDAALNLLTDSLEGLSTDQAIAILKGKATLTGNSRANNIELKKLRNGNKLQKAREERMLTLYDAFLRTSFART